MDDCVAGVEADSRRVFSLVFTALRGMVDIVFALLFEILTLILHIARKVGAFFQAKTDICFTAIEQIKWGFLLHLPPALCGDAGVVC